MDKDDAEQRVRQARDEAPRFGSGPLLATFTVRHRRGLDVAFVLDGADGDFQIGMGAASDDFRSVLTVGVDREDGRIRGVSSWTVDGRESRVPVRILHRSATVIIVEAAPLPLDRRPSSLKCWSFLRRASADHHSDVLGFVSPDLADLPPVRLLTDPRARRGR
ncbi:hypothetical protein GTU71_11015 [Rathayibacter sp. VKM Ac-2762]|uniref:hypothetical protein n=1 Tax=unclassified Rathayibacter TaxID=2609250 RepID=UPI000CE7F206|nr:MULTISPECIES: hypothetical protein [unclassified Rathayibacter]PPF14765.1 hypothetical protein C5B95_16765 [Rathayibacter sp. AY1A7]QHF21307.1 hypothetical protein GTU71_11015 [Rathayibacter sp. VKM Ac-2762]